MTRDTLVGALVLLLMVGGALAWRASLPAADPMAAMHERMARERQQGEALALQALCRSYRQNVTRGENMRLGGC